uniref:Variant surface glycoprotein BoTat-1 (Fragments) n=1 Tax=Trypanosoma equiperdum TaxID=5694 RepID=Q7M3W3_TRYEQ
AVANPLKKTYWEAMCDLSNDGNLLAQRAASRLKAPATTALKDTKTLLKALVFLESANSTLREAATKTAADYSARLQANLNFYTGTGTAREVQAARDGGRLQGALREFLATQAVVSASNKGCLSRTTGGPSALAAATATPSSAANDDNFKKAARRYPIEGILKNSPNLKKLGDVTDINQLLELYFYYSDLNKQRLQEAAKKLQDLETKAGTKSAAD